MVDDWTSAGHPADSIVLELQLQPSIAQSQDYPGFVFMASSKKKDAFGIEGSKIKFSCKSGHIRIRRKKRVMEGIESIFQTLILSDYPHLKKKTYQP